MTQAIILTETPTVLPIAEMALDPAAVTAMARWIQTRRPECLPDIYHSESSVSNEALMACLFPHDMTDGHSRKLSGNELLVELSGRKCYDSFGLKAGRKSNKDYIDNTQSGAIPHGSIMYHAKMSFFIGGVSRRVSHELIRHYVGADRTEEGSPSQESTRYVEHTGRFVAHPYILTNPEELKHFQEAMSENYHEYLSYIERQVEAHKSRNNGEEPKGMARKRIYESASPFLSHSCETSFIWTTNPIALAKLFKERCDEASDLEFQRLANHWKGIATLRWPNLFR